ncbi:MAG: hypothetical protein AAFO29_01910, partial [Actinomycetota bacterium]
QPLADTVALSEHLVDTLAVGDVVLTGADDPVSWIIQTGSRSPYSHVGLVTGPGQLIEAYDYALTPDESDEGVFTISLEEFLGRGDKLRAVEARRPEHIDTERLLEAAEHLLDHSPGFPTLGMAGLALCGLSGPVLRRLPERERHRVAHRQTALAGDGVRCVHCAETVTRLYHAAGVELRFHGPRLWDHLCDLLGARPGLDLARLPTGERRADPGRWPKGSMKATGFALSSARAAFRRRRQHDDRVDAADLILPGDFARAEPFTTVARYRRRAKRWIAFPPAASEGTTGAVGQLSAWPMTEIDQASTGAGRGSTGSRPASLSR